MFKKIILSLFLILALLSNSISYWEVWSTSWCEEWTWSLCSEKFEISISTILPFWDKSWIKKSEWWKKTAESLVVVITQKLMTALWIIALLIMTVWGGYMVFYHWQDELLSKWKKIFMSWIIALIVALSSSILVKFVAYIIFSIN